MCLHMFVQWTGKLSPLLHEAVEASLCPFESTGFSLSWLHRWLSYARSNLRRIQTECWGYSADFSEARICHLQRQISLRTNKRDHISGFHTQFKRHDHNLVRRKTDQIKNACLSLKRKSFTIRELAQVIGTLVAAFPAVRQGSLFYRELLKLKTIALKENLGNCEAIVHLSGACERELDWWIANVRSLFPPGYKSAHNRYRNGRF